MRPILLRMDGNSTTALEANVKSDNQNGLDKTDGVFVLAWRRQLCWPKLTSIEAISSKAPVKRKFHRNVTSHFAEKMR